jgi:single-strand DNA-binding protein
MSGINNVVLTGRLTRDVEMKTVISGLAICSFAIAIEHVNKKENETIKETSFIDLSLFGDRAKNLFPYLKKGKEIGIEGYLKQDRWEQDGKKRSQLEVKIEKISLLGSNGKKADSQNENDEQTDQHDDSSIDYNLDHDTLSNDAF